MEALYSASDGDVILYCDASRYDKRGFVTNPWLLFDAVGKTQNGLLASGFSYYLLNSQQRLYSGYSQLDACLGLKSFLSSHTLASHLLVKKSKFSVHFIQEWASLCLDFAKISSNRVADQALLNILIQKYRIDGVNCTNILSNKFKPHNEMKSVNFIIKAVDSGAEISVPKFITRYLLISYLWEIIRVLSSFFNSLKNGTFKILKRCISS